MVAAMKGVVLSLAGDRHPLAGATNTNEMPGRFVPGRAAYSGTGGRVNAPTVILPEILSGIAS